ncbi:hypothetical protein [Paenibacillus qinlingensis]|nr:hypothetical protein [Paenibacillus qinlingensis]
MKNIASYIGFLAFAVTIFLFIKIKIENGSDLGGLPAIMIPLSLVLIIASITRKALFLNVSLLLSLPLVSFWKPNMGSMGLLAIIPMVILLASLLMTYPWLRSKLLKSQS